MRSLRTWNLWKAIYFILHFYNLFLKIDLIPLDCFMMLCQSSLSIMKYKSVQIPGCSTHSNFIIFIIEVRHKQDQNWRVLKPDPWSIKVMTQNVRRHLSAHKTNKQTDKNPKKMKTQYKFDSFFSHWIHLSYSLMITCSADLCSKWK